MSDRTWSWYSHRGQHPRYYPPPGAWMATASIAGSSHRSAAFGSQAEAQMAKLRVIADGISQIVLLPVAHTIGTKLKLANREPFGVITYLDSWESSWPT